MSDQQHIPIQDSQEPSEEGKRAQALLDDLESKQLGTLDDAGKSIIERIATFLGVLFAITVLSNNFPPPYLKHNTSAKVFIIAALTCFLLAIGAGIWATQVRFYRRYTYNVSRTEKEVSAWCGTKCSGSEWPISCLLWEHLPWLLSSSSSSGICNGKV